MPSLLNYITKGWGEQLCWKDFFFFTHLGSVPHLDQEAQPCKPRYSCIYRSDVL